MTATAEPTLAREHVRHPDAEGRLVGSVLPTVFGSPTTAFEHFASVYRGASGWHVVTGRRPVADATIATHVRTFGDLQAAVVYLRRGYNPFPDWRGQAVDGDNLARLWDTRIERLVSQLISDDEGEK